MPPRLRKLALTIHVAASVGWLGAVVVFAALGVTGLYADDQLTVRGCYIAMDAATRWVILPLSVAALITGVVQGLGTQWGLFRHYWVIAKLVITVVSTALLTVHMMPIALLARAAAERPLVSTDLRRLRVQIVLDAVLAIVALITATVLSVYKPFGLSTYGMREEALSHGSDVARRARFQWRYLVAAALIALVLLALASHLSGSRFAHH